ncbi:MAG: hypothetical protein DDT19_01624 [Syntrophomonadaceae bacterium]|nr:hypothetical protein [Bacillota bacterium]
MLSGAPTGWQAPRTTWATSQPITTTDLNRTEGNDQATELGERTLDQALAAPANVGTLRQILSWFAGRIRAITGAANWFDAPATTLADAHAHHTASAPHPGHALVGAAAPGLDAHAAATTGVHGVGTSTVESAAGAQAKVDIHAGAAAPHTGHLRSVGGDTLQGGLVLTGIASPAAPTVTVVGVAGTTTYRYRVSARTRVGETLAGAEATITIGNATLSATNFNRISWPAVAGAIDYRVWRTFGGATTGAIATVTALTVDDTGLAASGVLPMRDTTAEPYWGVENSRGIQLPVGTDLNTVTNAGWYDVANALNRPPVIGDWTALIVTRGHSAAWVQQIAWDLFETTRCWMRKSRAGAWDPWVEVVLMQRERLIGVSHTLEIVDSGRMLTFQSTAALVLTIPTHAAVPLLVGTQILVHRLDTGAVTISPATGVRLDSAGGARSIRAQFGFAGLVKRADNVWALGGDLS